jgi:hypothetical protein
MEKSQLIPYLCVWALAALAIVRQTWRQAGSGLILAYCFQLFLLYWLGGAIHALPWSDLPQLDFVILGLQTSTYAIVALAVGSLVLGPLVANRIHSDRWHISTANPKLPRIYIVLGVVFYFVIGPTLGRLQGFNAVAAAGTQFVVVGISLNCWRAWRAGGSKPLFITLAPALLIPAATVVVQGFMSYGVIALATIITFCAQFFRPRWILLVSGLIVGWIGLSGYTAYMKDREDLRAVIWGGDSFSGRLDRTMQTIENAGWFDWNNPDNLEAIDGRLNQNTLVGAAVANLSNTGDYARGSTLVDAALGLIPRIIWPSKPPSGGSGDLVNRFTGITFAEGTSVGVGPVLELYGNFGNAGVWIGFVVLGCLLKVIDTMAGYHLRTGDWYGFSTWFLVGISLLNVSGSFVECTAGAIASLVLAKAVNAVLRRSDPHISVLDPAPA